MTKKKRLVALRKACKEDGVKLIELTYRDGRKSRISDRAAIAAVMDALDCELYKQIDALGGEPGVYSARYLGYDTDYNYKMTEIMRRMKDIPDEQRTARFVAAVGAIFPDGSEHVVRGAMEGIIGREICGQNGFGYDPFFYLPEYGMTSAEITEEQKNAISHRGKALRAMIALYNIWRAENDSSADGTI
jgi:non-canonical purine NTP pyrophosphatase (RdgB/HAM1 family)